MPKRRSDMISLQLYKVQDSFGKYQSNYCSLKSDTKRYIDKFKMSKVLSLAFLVASLAVLAYANLREDLDDIRALIPEEEIKNITQHYVENDAGVRRVFKYSKYSRVARKARLDVANDPDVKALGRWISDRLKPSNESEVTTTEAPVEPEGNDSAMDVIQTITADTYYANEFPALERSHGLGGWPAYVKAVAAVFPREELRELVKDKIQAGGDFADLYNLIKSHRETYERLIRLPSVRLHFRILRALRVDVKAIDRAVRKAFEWENSNSNIYFM